MMYKCETHKIASNKKTVTALAIKIYSIAGMDVLFLQYIITLKHIFKKIIMHN